eukprot:4514748-Prorocentrum_lima.AAC.1
MTSSLVGSEMCIRDRISEITGHDASSSHPERLEVARPLKSPLTKLESSCLLYTSDAADDM